MRTRAIVAGFTAQSVAVALAATTTPLIADHLDNGGHRAWLLLVIVPLAVAVGGLVAMVRLDRPKWTTHDVQEAAQVRQDAVDSAFREAAAMLKLDRRLAGDGHGAELTGREER
jgi:hypothetical protein